MSNRFDGVSELHDLFDRRWRALMEDQPEWATVTGWPEHHDRWTDRSIDAVERRRSEADEALEVLQRIDRAALSADDRLSYDLFASQERMQVDAAQFPAPYLAVDQLDGPQNDIPLVLSLMATSTDAQLGDYLARLRGIPTVLEQVRALLDEGVARGLTTPRVCLRDVPAQIDAHLADELDTVPELVPLARAPQPVRDEAAAIVREAVQPAFRALRDHLVERYMPACRESIAWTALPDGDEWYAERVRYHTTTDLTPKQIHDIGLGEVERLTAELHRLMDEVGWTGTREAFTTHLQTDPRFFFDSEDALLIAYRDIAKRIDPALPKLFRLMPRLPFGIIPTPPEQAASAAGAMYVPGSSELGRPGYFYANTFDLPSRPSWNMESICLHEASPGHHFQLTIAQELEDLPRFRRDGMHCTAYVEGWGLYCETLGEELGLYTDPYQRVGAVDAELLRAIRLVTDTGMHAFGWTREQSIAFFEAHSPMPRHEIETEVDRYIVLPGQAVSYKIGQLKLTELRARSAERLGPRFDVRDFHDLVLRNGALPLDVLEQLVDEWLSRTLSSCRA